MTDWQPRGTVKSLGTDINTAPDLINLQTGSLKQLVIASTLDQAQLSLTFIGKADAPKAYRAYVFRKEEPFTTISGIESGLEKKALRFAAHGENPDLVQVFVNGVQREQGTGPTDYQVANGTLSSVAPNTIVFNTLIDQSGTTQVDVIISKKQPANAYQLTFTRNRRDESRIGTGAYENVNYVEGMVNSDVWQRYYLYTLDLDLIAPQIPLNSILIPPQDKNVMFLLARRPYTQLDRYADVVMRLDGLSEERDFVKYYAADGVTTARATASSLVTLFPPLRFTKFTMERPLSTITPGDEEQIVIDGKVITGPDA
ncbi:hypothetical protein [Acinetobacter sp.]|uniref:hypothetical protein n=1 Tax=Acinetobacter sp. TaxID=472 RepID=UPI00388D0E2D